MQPSDQTPVDLPPQPLTHTRPVVRRDEQRVRDGHGLRVPAGARLVRFELCVSVGFFTLRRQSAVFLTTSRGQRLRIGLGYAFASLLLGPWGVPWGLILTPWAIWVDLTGGIDETEAILGESFPTKPIPRESAGGGGRDSP